MGCVSTTLPPVRFVIYVTLSKLLSHILQDDQTHFAHPIIASTAKLFYFDKWHAISAYDQDTFKGSVPKPLVALIGTVVCFILTFLYNLIVANNIYSTGMRSTNRSMAIPPL